MDPRNQDSWCIGTVIDIDGPRLRIRLDGTDDRNDFWRLVDSAEIRCYGTTERLVSRINHSMINRTRFCLAWTNCSATWFSTNIKSMEKFLRTES